MPYPNDLKIQVAVSLEDFKKRNFRMVTATEFATQHGFTWALDPTLDVQLPQIKMKDIPRLPDTNNLGLYYINPTLGYNVCTLTNIPAETPLTTYAGEPKPHQQLTEEAIQSGIESVYIHQIKDGVGIDASQIRDLGGYLPHLPSKETLEQDYVISDPEILKQVARSNVIWRICKYEGKNVFSAFAKRLLRKNEIVGFDYGDFYFDRFEIIPTLFGANGIPLSTQDYKPTYFVLKVKEKVGFRYSRVYKNDLFSMIDDQIFTQGKHIYARSCTTPDGIEYEYFYALQVKLYLQGKIGEGKYFIDVDSDQVLCAHRDVFSSKSTKPDYIGAQNVLSNKLIEKLRLYIVEKNYALVIELAQDMMERADNLFYENTPEERSEKMINLYYLRVVAEFHLHDKISDPKKDVLIKVDISLMYYSYEITTLLKQYYENQVLLQRGEVATLCNFAKKDQSATNAPKHEHGQQPKPA